MTDRRPELPKIEVDADAAASAGMPEDLDANVLGPYTVPDPARRRQSASVYLIAAAITAAGIFAGLPSRMWLIVAIFVAIAAYYFGAGVHLKVTDKRALTLATGAVGFPVGHASAVLGFDGVMARPVWNVLVFSAEEPPAHRGLVRVDGRSGHVLETYAEAVPPTEEGAAENDRPRHAAGG
jgi:hypothetical protein